MSGGFGHNNFGNSPFGRADWTEIILHGNVPKGNKNEDLDAEGLFMFFLDCMKPSFDFNLRKIDNFRNLRRPGFVNSVFTTTQDITIDSVESIEDSDDGWGEYISIVCDASIGDISAGWKSDYNGIIYDVIRIFKSQNRIDVSGVIEPTSGVMRFYAPEQLTSLYRDYGLYPDRYFDDTFLRGEVEHAVSWLSLKGSNNGYVYRGKISGFDVTISPIWRVDDDWAGMLDSTEVFRYPDSDGHQYTTVAPYFVLYDDIISDSITTDTLASEIEESLEFSYSVDTVNTSNPYLHEVGFNTTILEVGEISNWKLIDSDNNEFWIEERLDDSTFAVAGIIVPSYGECILKYIPPLKEDSLWAKSNLLSVEIQPNETFYTITADSGDTTKRLIEKLYDVKPAHVRFARIVETHSGTTLRIVSITSESLESSEAMAGYSVFDVMPSDYEEIDEDIVSI